jgi:hypothetical protein
MSTERRKFFKNAKKGEIRAIGYDARNCESDAIAFIGAPGMPAGLGARARQRRFSKARSALRHRSKAACPASPWLRRACRAGAAAAKTGQGWLQSVAVSSSDIWMDFAAGMDAAPKWLNPADGQMAHNPASEPDFLAQRESFPAYLAAILNG